MRIPTDAAAKKEKEILMVYVIKISLNGSDKYIYTAAAPVDTIESAHKFYSRSYAKRYIAVHGLKNAVVIKIDS